MLAVCCVQAAHSIQKLKKVSKSVDDGKQWTVAIYEVENPAETVPIYDVENTAKNEPDNASDKQGKRISQSKFKKDTDGLFTTKLHFDFRNTGRNKVVYGPKGQECKVMVAEFDPVTDLTAVLNQNCTIDFYPPIKIGTSKFASESVSTTKRPTQEINVNVPESKYTMWFIASGDLTHSKLKNTRKKYKLDEISGTSADINNKKLRIYTDLPSKIAVKEGNAEYIISTLKQADLDNIKETGVVNTGADGQVVTNTPARKRSVVASVVASDEEPTLRIHSRAISDEV